MSSTNRRFIVAYIILVGMPLLGLAGVLKVGRGINAPYSIDGTWKLDPASIRPTGQSCDKALAALSASSFVISQSGQTLMLTLNNAAKISAQGSLQGPNLKVLLGMTDASAAGCTAGQPLMLTATIDPKAEPRSLTGALSVGGCASCTAVEFRASRQPKSQSGGAH